jgi:ABC-type glycerol-3-phosphate transport system substrate-binding protein
MPASRLSRRQVIKSGATAAASAALLPIMSPAVANARSAAIQTSTNLRMMVWGRPEGVTWDTQAYQRVNPEGAKNLTVEPIVGGQGDAEVAEQFRLMLSAGGGDVPDIIHFNRIQIPEFAAAGVLTDLTDKMAPFKNDIIESAYALASFDEKVIAVPNQLKSKVWFYRADIFEKAGIDPDAVATWDDFIAAGLDLHQKLPKSFIYNMRQGLTGYRLQNILTSYAPVSFFDRDAGKFQITSHPGFRGLFEAVDKLRNPELVAPVDDFDPEWAPAFVSGTLASTLINEWMTSFLPQYVPEQAGLWKAHAWPAVGNSNQGSDSGGSLYVIPKQAKNPEAAFEFLSTVHLTKEGALALLEVSGQNTVVKSARDVVPTMPKPVATPGADHQIPWPAEFFGESYFPVVYAAQERLKWIDFDPRSATEIALLGEWSQRFTAGEVDVDGVLEGLQNDLESQIGDPWQV